MKIYGEINVVLITKKHLISLFDTVNLMALSSVHKLQMFYFLEILWCLSFVCIYVSWELLYPFGLRHWCTVFMDLRSL